MSSTETKVIEKIEKLLRLSKSPNEHEAFAALLKARKLMLKYHIDKSNVKNEVVETRTISNVEKWQLAIYHEIGKNMRCKCLLKTIMRNENVLEHQILIIGFSTDVDVVETLSSFLIQVCDEKEREKRLELKEKDYYADTRGFSDYWRNGFVEGITLAFFEQNLLNSGYSLLATIPKEVELEVAKIGQIGKIYVNKTDAGNPLGHLIKNSASTIGYVHAHDKVFGDKNA